MGRPKRVSTAQPLLLTVTDVAIQLGVSRQSVYTYMYREGLPSMLLRGVRRIHPESLQQWLKQKEHIA